MLSVQHDSMNVFYSTWWLKDIIFHKSFSFLRGFFQLQSCWFISDRCFERSTYFMFSPRKCLHQSSILPTYHIFLRTFIFWLRLYTSFHFATVSHFSLKKCFFKKLKTSLEACFSNRTFMLLQIGFMKWEQNRYNDKNNDHINVSWMASNLKQNCQKSQKN